MAGVLHWDLSVAHYISIIVILSIFSKIKKKCNIIFCKENKLFSANMVHTAIVLKLTSCAPRRFARVVIVISQWKSRKSRFRWKIKSR